MSKLTKDELRSPDEFLKSARSAYSWMENRWLTGFLLVGVLFIGTVSFLYWQQVQMKKEAEAQHVFGELTSLFEQWELAADDEARQTQLAEIQETWTELTQAHHGSEAEGLGNLIMGRLAFSQKNYQQAVNHFQAYKKVLPKENQDLADYPLAQSYEALQQWDSAEQTYQQILQHKQSSFRKWAFLGRARSLRQLEEWDGALALYDEFLREFPSAPEASEVRGLKLLAQKRKVL